jgi:hypothetical protein
VGVAGSVLTLTVAVYSEVVGLWYNEDPYKPSNFFALDRSCVTWICYPKTPEGLFTGIALYQQGWSTRGTLIREFVPREWTPLARVDRTLGCRYLLLRVPLWLPLIAFGGLAWWGWRVRRWYGADRCQKCGYDVRGVPGVCPECGTVIAVT